MHFEAPLFEGKLIKRYQRFFADIEWNQQIVTAHVPNTGSLKGALGMPQKCLFTANNDPGRKLKYTLQLIKSNSNSWVGVNTGIPNALIRETLTQILESPSTQCLPPHSPQLRWSTYTAFKPEFKISKESRIDFLLSKVPLTPPPDLSKRTPSSPYHFIEVKNVSLAVNGAAYFPDAVTERGQKHLRELMHLMEMGHSCEILFTVQRSDVESFAPADDIDPEYGKLLREAQKKGLIITPLKISFKSKRGGIEETSSEPLDSEIILDSTPLKLTF